MVTNSGHSALNLIFEEYRRPVVKYMENYIIQIKEDPQSISPILDRVFDEAKIYGLTNLKGHNFRPALMLKYIQDNSLTLLKAILRQTSKFKDAKHHINVEKAIFVIGAGFSYESGAPMRTDLDDILRFVGVSDFAELRGDLPKCFQFKKQFQTLINRSNPGLSHNLIAASFPSNVIEIICLNWDNLIERAFKALGKSPKKINKESEVNERSHLWKFHGDIEEFNDHNQAGNLGWVFPDEGGYVFECFKDYLSRYSISSELFSLFIVGYSEKDDQVNKVIAELEMKPQRPTYRIGIEIDKLHDDFYLLGPSPFILSRILG